MKVQAPKNPFNTFGKLVDGIGDQLSPEQVHKLRTTSRRIKVAERNLELNGRQDDLIGDIDRLRKRAGKLRDLDVQLLLVQELGDRPGVSTLREFLEARRAKAERKLLERTLELNNRKTRATLTELAGKLKESAPASKVYVARTQAALAKLQARLDPDRLREDDEYLHDLRIRIKKARYIAEGDLSESGVRLAERLKTVQDAIGKWHDWLQLLGNAERQLDESAAAALLAQIRSWTASSRSAAVSAVEDLLEKPAPQKKRPATSGRPTSAFTQTA